MTQITFTKRESDVMMSRLSVPDCIAEALTDTRHEDAPSYSYAEALTLAEQLETELERDNQVTINSDVARDIVADAVDGSTYPYFLYDAVENLDMTSRERAGWRRVLSAIERKLAAVGIDASFPPY